VQVPIGFAMANQVEGCWHILLYVLYTAYATSDLAFGRAVLDLPFVVVFRSTSEKQPQIK
jgi:hypothetical protein